ncbi:hypothetical protein BgiBS90_020575 [Biomphalaria glabrata]|nr:hypothetical protein BgiBS90_020575 [Biomphalaria glabrata]
MRLSSLSLSLVPSGASTNFLQASRFWASRSNRNLRRCRSNQSRRSHEVTLQLSPRTANPHAPNCANGGDGPGGNYGRRSVQLPDVSFIDMRRTLSSWRSIFSQIRDIC